MMQPTPRPTLISLLLRCGLAAGAFGVAGCSGGGGGGGSSADLGGTAPGERPVFAVSDPVKLSQLREQAIELLVQTATVGAPEARANAIEGLLAVPSRLKPLLPLALREQNIGVRAVAALAAGRGKFRDLAPQVQAVLPDPSPFVYSAAIYALTRMGESVNPTPLAGMLKSPDLRVRAQGAFILGELGNTSAVGLLREAASASPGRAEQARVRMLKLQIAEALVKLGDDGAVQEIRTALFPASTEDLEAAALAAQILGQLRDQSSSGQLVSLTAMWNEERAYYPAEIRLAAAGALAKLGNPRGGFIAATYWKSTIPPQRAQAALVFGETRLPENLPYLSAMINDPEPLVKVAAAAAILKITEREGQ